MPNYRIRVLSASPDATLRSLRAAVLSQAGFLVSSPPTKSEILLEIKQKHFDVLVLGHRWPTLAMQELAEAFKRRNPRSCVIVLTASPWSKPPVADLTVYAAEGPDAVVAAIKACVLTSDSSSQSPTV